MGGDKYLSTVNPDELVERYYDQYSLPRLILIGDGRPVTLWNTLGVTIQAQELPRLR
jgi:hypothetical protein